jgi:hypothetical protein
MKKILCLVASSLIFSTQANVEIEGFPNKVRLSLEGNVDVRLFLTDNVAIDCAGEEYHFSFPYEGMGQSWMAMFQEARVMGQAITIDYDESNCQVTAVSLPLLFEDGGTTSSGPLEETGAQANVALIGSNGLSESNYSASSQYLNDSPAAAFDGFSYNEKINEDSSYKISRGIWLAKIRDANGEALQNWIQVDFGKAVRLAQLRSVVNAKSVSLGRSPRTAVLYISNDGTNYSIADSLSFARGESSNWAFPKTITAQYFKLVITANYGDTDFVEIDELEFFQ